MAATCCKSKSTCIMYTANILLLLIGIAVAGVAGAMRAHRADLIKAIPSYANAVPAGAVVASLSGGIALIVLAVVGLCGAKFYEKCCGKLLLTLYTLFVFVTLVLHIVVVALLFSMSSQFQQFKSTYNSPSLNEAQQQLQQLSNSTFNLCCSNGAVTNAQGCQYLSVVVTATTCSGTFHNFEDKLMDYLSGQFKIVGIVGCVVALIEACVFVSSCCLLCRGKDKKETLKNQDGYYNQAEYQPAPGAPVQYA